MGVADRLPNGADRLRSGAALGLAGLVLWLSFLNFPGAVAGDDLDLSWQQALGYFFKHHLQAGVDYVFTFGPLGTFYTSAYDPDLYAVRWVWEVVVGLAVTVPLLALLKRLPERRGRAGLFALLLLCMPVRADSLYPFVILLLTTLVADRERGAGPGLGVAAFLGILSLVKFTLCLLSVASLTLLLVFLASRRRSRCAGAVVAGFLGTYLAGWLLCGQALANLPAYLRGALEITSGFPDAMGLAGEPLELALALVLLGLLGTGVLTCLAWRTPRGLLQTGLLATGLALEWKHGFARHDCHSLVFFGYAVLVPFYLVGCYDGMAASRGRVRLLGLCVLLALVGRFAMSDEPPDPLAFLGRRVQLLSTNLTSVFAPQVHRDVLEADLAKARERHALPHVRAAVGDAPIDMVSYEQGVLFLNDLHYRPRPVFQSYSAYTPYLLQLNAAFFRGDRAPEFVLLSLQTIDNRLAVGDDGPVLLELLRHYVPVLEENGYALLRRRPGLARTAVPTFVEERSIRLGEEVVLPGDHREPLSLTVQTRPTLYGRIRKAVLRAAPLELEVHLEDGRTLVSRLIPGMAQEPFLLHPLLLSTADYVHLARGHLGNRVRSFVVRGGVEARAAYGSTVDIRLAGAGFPKPAP